MTDALLGLGVLILCAMTAVAIIGTVRYTMHPKMRREVKVLWRIIQGIGLAWPLLIAVYTIVYAIRQIGRLTQLLLGG